MHNTIRGLRRSHGLKVGEVHRNKFADRIRELLREAPLLEVAVGPLLRMAELLVAGRAILDVKLNQAAKGDEVCCRMMTIPGIGPITA